MLLAGSPGETMPASRGYMNPAALMTASGHERTSTLGSLLVSCGPGAEVIALLVSFILDGVVPLFTLLVVRPDNWY